MLLLVARPDPPHALAELADRLDLLGRAVPAAERRVRRVLAVLEQQVLVGLVRLLDRERAVGVELVDVGGGDVDLGVAGVELLDVDALRRVLLGLEPERVGADAEVDVLRDEDRRPVAIAVPDLERHADDEVVDDLRRLERVGELLRRQRDRELAAVRQRDAVGEALALLAELVEAAGDLARVAAALRQLLLEVVDLLEDVDRDEDVVVLEVEHRPRIVEQDVRVEDVVLLHAWNGVSRMRKRDQ